MEEKSTSFEVLLERVQVYTETSIRLFKFKATEKIAGLVSGVASQFVIAAILFLFFLNLNIGVALLLGGFLNKTWMGFMILAGLYFFAGLIVYLFRNRWIKTPVSNAVITHLLDEDQFSDK
jgi:hypothetical protein